MGRAKRIIPKNFPEKLKKIRNSFGVSLEGMATRLEEVVAELGYPQIKLYSGNIYEYEQGTREPLLPVLLAYARIVNVSVDTLIDHQLEFHLPDKLIN